MDGDGRWVTINGTHIFIKEGQNPMDAFIRQKNNKKEKRINDHILKYNGYYIMSAKPNVGYLYEKLENSKFFSIYDAKNDDITHNIANWIQSIEDAKKYIDDMKKWGILK